MITLRSLRLCEKKDSDKAIQTDASGAADCGRERQNAQIEYHPSFIDYISMLCIAWCGALIGFLGWRFLWVLDYEITRTEFAGPFTDCGSRKVMNVDVFYSFEALPGIPMLLIGLLVILLAIETFLRKVVVTTTEIESKSPLGLYKQGLEVEAILDSRITWLARVGKVVEMRYKNRWLVFLGNKRFTDVVEKGFLRADHYAKLGSNQSEHSTE